MKTIVHTSEELAKLILVLTTGEHTALVIKIIDDRGGDGGWIVKWEV